MLEIKFLIIMKVIKKFLQMFGHIILVQDFKSKILEVVVI